MRFDRKLVLLALAAALPGCALAGAGGSDGLEIEGGKGTHVIGLYEGPSEHSAGYHPVGELPVTVEAQAGEIALAVTSYEPVRVIVQGPGAKSVGALYLNGYHRHSVDGVAPGTTVVNYSGGKDFRPETPRDGRGDDGGWGAGNVPAAYRHVSSGQNSGHEREAIEGNARSVLGRPIASITQAYRASAITILGAEAD